MSGRGRRQRLQEHDWPLGTAQVGELASMGGDDPHGGQPGYRKGGRGL
ncbi:MAG: hypothetical protein HY902_03395 [Deltaproteobacteria bacterium]|nr:hypothetical protein [Deltaproteobacteria bacterium]